MVQSKRPCSATVAGTLSSPFALTFPAARRFTSVLNQRFSRTAQAFWCSKPEGSRPSATNGRSTDDFLPTEVDGATSPETTGKAGTRGLVRYWCILNCRSPKRDGGGHFLSESMATMRKDKNGEQSLHDDHDVRPYAHLQFLAIGGAASAAVRSA